MSYGKFKKKNIELNKNIVLIMRKNYLNLDHYH